MFSIKDMLEATVSAHGGRAHLWGLETCPLKTYFDFRHSEIILGAFIFGNKHFLVILAKRFFK